MAFGIYNFNHPVDTCIEGGLFHVHAVDAFRAAEATPIGSAVFGLDPKARTIDTIATVTGYYKNCEFRSFEDQTVLQLEVSKLQTPITIPDEIVTDLSSVFGTIGASTYFQDVNPVPTELVTKILPLLGDEYQGKVGNSERIRAGNGRIADISAILCRDDLSTEDRAALALARNGLGKFGDSVWARDIGNGFDKEEIMGDELRVIHIRPWRTCIDAQRLDPDNGLLLPHVIADAFENGYATFDEAGEIVFSGHMMRRLWNLEGSTGDFCRPLEMTRGQHLYMHYHRRAVYENWQLPYACAPAFSRI